MWWYFGLDFDLDMKFLDFEVDLNLEVSDLNLDMS